VVTNVNVDLLPHVGVGAYRLGMSVEEARAEAQHWGRPSARSKSEAEPGQIVVTHDESEMNIVLGFTKHVLAHIEVWRFRNEEADVHVTLEGLDVLRVPSEELQERLEARGHTVEENDMGFDAVPDLKMIFSNASSYEYQLNRYRSVLDRMESRALPEPKSRDLIRRIAQDL
jgi:hypothetical protein